MKRCLGILSVLLLSTSGCMQVRQEIVVMPDGSGRLTLHFTIKTKGEASKFTQDELLSADPDEIQDKIRGLVAIARPLAEEKEGVVHLRMTGYFDDLNAVKFMDDGEGDKAKAKQEFVFRKEGESFVVELKGNLLADDIPERVNKDPEVEKQREEFFKAMFEGFDFRQDVRMPGKVTLVEGFQSRAERTASYHVGEKDLQRPSDQKKINEISKFKVSCARSEVTDAEAADFRKEVEKAKADWVGLRKEMKQKAEQKK
jgi:hypothetical protein